MKKINLARWAPVGLNLKQELQFFGAGMVFATLYSLQFFQRYGSERSNLYANAFGRRVLLPDAVMPDFHLLLRDYWAGFAILALCMLALSAYHYLYHRQGSKSIYLMRRLPSRFELPRRCLALPLLAIFLCVVAVCLLLVLFYWTYRIFTPEGCLTPHQWGKLWSVIQ